MSSGAQEQQATTVKTAEKGHMVQPSLLKALYKAYGLQYLLLGVIKLGNDILNFAGPLLLNALIRYLETPPRPVHSEATQEPVKGQLWRPWLPQPDSLAFGLCCTGLLGVTSLIKVGTAILCLCVHQAPPHASLYACFFVVIGSHIHQRFHSTWVRYPSAVKLSVQFSQHIASRSGE